MIKKGVVSAAILLIAVSMNAQVVSEWRGLGRTGVYTNETNLLKVWPQNGPELLWYVDSIPKGYASVAVAYSKVFVTGIVNDKDVLMAYDMEGQKLWETPYGRAWNGSYEHSRCTPTVENNRIFLSSGLGDVACLNAENGSIIWEVKAVDIYEGAAGKYGYAESLLLVDDKVFFTPAGEKTTMVALNKNTGETLWESKSLNDNASYASPLIIEAKGKKMILNLTEHFLFSLNPENGELMWQFDFGEYAGGKSKRNNQTNTPLFFNNEIFLTSGYDHKSVMLSLAEDGNDVKVKWVDTILDVHYGGVVQIDGYIYGTNWLHNRMGNWACIKWDTGKVMYSEEWHNKGSIIAADSMLYCYEEKLGTMGIAPINPEKFEIVSSFKLPYGDSPFWAHPVIKNGKLFLRSSTALMVYNIKRL
ncbi:MAG: PQQ-binding-like beta-propeller repeat protein [Salinivirgaceae bacterium]|jgi:outer membrane protein assembly factor BamB|nr:PQQ-binding-like beta-propeller repeat protein [Salinivirgaceae bacterium]